MTYKSWMSWSTGKDSSFALMKCLNSSDIEVSGMFSTVTDEVNRVSMHSTRVALLEQQASSIGLPLHIVKIPVNCTNEIYENKMIELIGLAKKNNVNSMIFGDLFLEDVKSYREKNLSETGITPLFPLWEYGAPQLAKDLIELGFKAIVTCVDQNKLGKEFVGRQYDISFLDDLPEGVDPCGEFGEFHTFVYDGPIFSYPINCKVGEVVDKTGFHFADILPT